MFRFRAFFASLALAAILFVPTAVVFAADAQSVTRPCGPNNSPCTKSDIKCTKDDDCRGSVGAWTCSISEGYCYLNDARQAEYSATTSIFGVEVRTTDVPLAKPALEVHIPGLNFSDINQTLDKDGYIHVPYIGEFLSAVYKYALGIGTILAVIMIIKNGVTIILSAGGEGKMESFHQIGQVVIGLMIMWGSFVILNAINPSLTQFKALRIKYVRPTQLEKIDTKTYLDITKQNSLISTNDLMSMAILAGIKVGFSDPCFMATILTQESGVAADVIGHDENYPGKAKSDTRKTFLTSGNKFSGASFTAVPAEGFVSANDNQTDVRNDDDKTFSNSPPDYKLDWRFSHGFGLGQITLQPDYSCGGGRGRDINGTCFTIPDLLTPNKNLEFTAELFKQAYDCAGSAGYGGRDQITAAFLAYNLGCSGMKKLSLDEVKQHPYAVAVMLKYDKCVANPPKIIAAPSSDFVTPVGDNIVLAPSREPIVVSQALLDLIKPVAQDLKAKNIVLEITSGYRTMAYQMQLAKENCTDLSNPSSCSPLTCIPKNDDPTTCPHTIEQAVDAWGSQSGAQCITQAACKGSAFPNDNVNDPCRANSCQAEVIAAFRAHGFCSLNKEAWHFEQPQKSTNCS